MKKLLNNIGDFVGSQVSWLVVAAVVLLCSTFLLVGTRSDDGSVTLDGRNSSYSKAQEKAFCELDNQKDAAVSQLLGTEIPQDSGSGCDPTDVPQLGSIAYYKVDVSSPAAFYNAVNGRGFNEGYGMQCVAGFKEFMYAVSGQYVATKNGGANGYASQQSQIEPLGFTWHNGGSGLQNGDWGIFGGGTYGHVAMYYNGKWFGQNQGASNASVGNAFNLLDLGSFANTIIGYYRPNIYKTVASSSSPGGNNSSSTSKSDTGSSNAIVNSNSYTVRRGDTLGGISLNQGWWNSTVGLYGDSGYAQRVANQNGITNRGTIYPNQVIKKAE